MLAQTNDLICDGCACTECACAECPVCGERECDGAGYGAESCPDFGRETSDEVRDRAE